MHTERITQAKLKIPIMEKRFVSTLPMGSINNAKYEVAVKSPIYVEEAPSRRAKRVIIIPTSKFQEIALKILK